MSAYPYDYISADTHVNIFAERFAHRVPEKFRDRLPRRTKLPNGGDATIDEEGQVNWGGTGHFSGKPAEEFDPTILHFDLEVGHGPPEQRLRELNADEGIGAEIEFGYPAHNGLRGIKDKEMNLAVIRGYNEYVAEEFCSVAPDRFLGIGVLPHCGVDEDIAELEHCAKLGLHGVQLVTYPGGQNYPTPEDDRFWAAALDLGMPVTIHTSLFLNHGRRGDFMLKYPHEPQGYDRPPVDPVQQMTRYMHGHCGGLELGQMILSGVFDRFPKLKIFWAENNVGWIPMFLEQMDLSYEQNRYWSQRILGLKPLARRPSEYAREHAYWGFFDDPFGMRVRYEVGVDHILWGGDFPHEPTRWPRTREYMQQQLNGVPEEEQRKMMRENAIKFFHLDRSSGFANPD